MMIGDDDRHAQLFCAGDRVKCGDAIVAGQKERDTISGSFLHKRHVESVAIPDTVGNRPVHIGVERCEAAVQHRDGADTIGIIVSDDADTLFVLNCGKEQIHRQRQILHEKRIRQVVQRSV